LKIPDNYAKLLISGISDPYYLAYHLGKFNIYLQHFRLLETGSKATSPVFAVVRYEDEEDINGFITEFGLEAKVRRVFKSGKYFTEDNVNMQRNFLWRTAENLLGLLHGKTLSIKCKDPAIRKRFFDVLEEANKKNQFGCKFDYDHYDVEVEIRPYTVKGNLWLIVTTSDTECWRNIDISDRHATG
jgi:hypothetical protein